MIRNGNYFFLFLIRNFLIRNGIRPKQIGILERDFWFKEYELESLELAMENFDKESVA